MTKFARDTCEIHYYNPRAGYGYYELTQPTYVLPQTNVIGMKKVIALISSVLVRVHKEEKRVTNAQYLHDVVDLHGKMCTSIIHQPFPNTSPSTLLAFQAL